MLQSLILLFLTSLQVLCKEFPDPAQLEKFKQILTDFKEANHVPCLVGGFVQEYSGNELKVFYEAIDGVSDIDNGAACTVHSAFRIAGLSKAIESLFTAKLVENGTLSWHQDIHRWISEETFPVKYWNGQPVDINLAQLLSHQSGIRGTLPQDVMHYWETRIFNTTQTVQFFADDPLLGEPGAQFIYSNNGINLVAAIIESIQNRPYNIIVNDFLREFDLTTTEMDNAFELISRRATQYKPSVDSKGDFHYLPAPITDDLRPYPHWAAEGLISNAGDLLFFSKKLLDIYKNRSTVLEKETLEYIWNAKTEVNAGKTLMVINNEVVDDIETNYVLGWQRYDFPTKVPETLQELSNLTMIFHTAQFESAGAILAIFPEKLFTLSVIMNLGEMDAKLPKLVVESFLDLYNPKTDFKK